MNRFASVIASITLLLPAAAMADSPAPSGSVSQSVDTQTLTPAEQRLDPMAFCYVEGKAYSEGWRLDGLVCARGAIGNVFEADQKPLAWRRVSATE